MLIHYFYAAPGRIVKSTDLDKLRETAGPREIFSCEEEDLKRRVPGNHRMPSERVTYIHGNRDPSLFT